jgi:TPR repeat protein
VPPSTEATKRDRDFDVFVSHATEDKGYVNVLVIALQTASIRVWFDSYSLGWGDDLRPSIDRGLANCSYGIVVFSPAFLCRKKWTEYELNALFAREQLGRKVILPIWHGITREDLVSYSPAFADRLAKSSSHDRPEDIAASLLDMLGRSDEKREPPPDQAALRNSAGIQPASGTNQKRDDLDEQERQNALGDFYRNEKKNIAEALVWYHKSADQGFPAAQCTIGYLYYMGEGVTKDYQAAMKWFLKAADQDFAPALFNIGNLYSEGAGVEKDSTKSMYWWRRAADRGDTSAQQNIGLLYCRGESVTKDYEQAMAWFHKALEQGDASALDEIRGLRRHIAKQASFRGAKEGGVSPSAMALLEGSFSDLLEYHRSGDWGNITLELELRNMRALKTGGAVFSEYLLRSGETIQIQTDDKRRSFFISVKGEQDI